MRTFTTNKSSRSNFPASTCIPYVTSVTRVSSHSRLTIDACISSTTHTACFTSDSCNSCMSSSTCWTINARCSSRTSRTSITQNASTAVPTSRTYSACSTRFSSRPDITNISLIASHTWTICNTETQRRSLNGASWCECNQIFERMFRKSSNDCILNDVSVILYCI